MRHLSVRDIPQDLAKALQKEKVRSGLSLNQTVKQLLRRALGVGSRAPVENGLARHAGSWSEQELAEFESHTAGFDAVDDEIWQ